MQRKLEKREYTYKDYMTWPENEHWELIDGEAYPTYGATALAAPSRIHQALVVELIYLLKSYLRDKRCEVYVSPFDVVFEESENTKTVVQPDILVVCDLAKLENGKRVIGAPDIAIEVLSPSTAPKDWMKKSQLYERQGVKEYWIVSPDARTIYKNTLKDGLYEDEAFEKGALTSAVLEDFSLDVAELFSVLDTEQPEGADQEGEERRAMEIAEKLLRKGYPPEDIADATGLALATIEEIKLTV